MTDQLASAIVGHLFGDYLIQNEIQALNKKSPTWFGLLMCLIHCSLWTASVCAFGQLGWRAAIVLFVTHFIQDRTTIINRYMDAIGQKSFRTGICAPWSVIVVDNVWHIATIFAVCKTGL